jgi:hypothetical protein
MCETLYEDAYKCEISSDGLIADPVTTGCEFINMFLPSVTAGHVTVTDDSISFVDPKALPVVFAWLFGISTVLLGAYAYTLQGQEKRTWHDYTRGRRLGLNKRHISRNKRKLDLYLKEIFCVV